MALTGKKDYFIFVLSAPRTGTHLGLSDKSEVVGTVQTAWKLKFNSHDENIQRA